ncbi:uncharacterized protein JCM15063_002658 [Sporobolomyces koalae]|uniref:uncharacterized protein n=1 Tax=Sporobolomyces koalae TaxID=500713 RepID=UPI0031826C19
MPTILNSALALPPATRGLTLCLIASSTVYFFLRLSAARTGLDNARTGDAGTTVPWLNLVPANVLYAPWTLVTAAFTETNMIEFLVSLLTLPLSGRYLERVWGASELVKFVLFTVIVSNGIAVVVSVIESIVLGNQQLFLHDTSYHGLEALQVGFLVAFTQLIPEHQVQMFGGILKMRVKSLPMAYVTFSNVACLLGYQSPYILIQFGWLVSWLYLRFLKKSEGSDFRGDRSETFAFHNWFPPFIQKYVAILSNFVFSLAVKFNLIQSWSSIDLESGPGSSASTNTVGGQTYTSVPGGARAEAERRRAMALEALDRRMASKPPTSSTTPTVAAAATVGVPPSPAATPEPTSGSTAAVTHEGPRSDEPSTNGVADKV